MRKYESPYLSQFKFGLIVIVIAAMIMLANECLGQSNEQREQNAKAHKYQTEFNGMNVNFVNMRVQNFLQKEMTMGVSGEPKVETRDSVVVITDTYSAEPEYQFKIQYTCKPSGNAMLIQSCKIYGSPRQVTKFFVWFWETKLNFEEAKKDEVVVSYFTTDRVSLMVQPSKKYAEIVVVRM